jgi:hypothetical protein
MIFDRKNLDNDTLLAFYKKIVAALVEEKMLILLTTGPHRQMVFGHRAGSHSSWQYPGHERRRIYFTHAPQPGRFYIKEYPSVD